MHIVGTQNHEITISPNLMVTLNDLLTFPLIDAIGGRRSRRFCLGAEIPDGVLSYKSKHDPVSNRTRAITCTINYGRSNRMAFCYNTS